MLQPHACFLCSAKDANIELSLWEQDFGQRFQEFNMDPIPLAKFSAEGATVTRSATYG